MAPEPRGQCETLAPGILPTPSTLFAYRVDMQLNCRFHQLQSNWVTGARIPGGEVTGQGSARVLLNIWCSFRRPRVRVLLVHFFVAIIRYGANIEDGKSQ